MYRRSLTPSGTSRLWMNYVRAPIVPWALLIQEAGFVSQAVGDNRTKVLDLFREVAVGFVVEMDDRASRYGLFTKFIGYVQCFRFLFDVIPLLPM
jgi:hypothetical protein